MKLISPPAEIQSFIASEAFPCIMARAAVRNGRVSWCEAGKLGSREATARATKFLYAYLDRAAGRPAEFESAICGFEPLGKDDEWHFERRLWDQLRGMHDHDRKHFAWDERVSADPDSPEFSFSIGGEALYVVGMHPGASRPARRAPHPMLVFNLHEQFQELRRRGRYEAVKTAVRERDLELAGSVNPMLADFGEQSEARQYAGRVTGSRWACPFRNRRTD